MRACYTHARALASPAYALPDPAQIGHLPGVLQIVGEDTDQPHPDCGPWLVLGLIKLAIKIRRCEAPHERFRARRDAVMIVQQGLDRGRTKSGHLLRCVPLALIVGVRGHAKLRVPSLADPGLLLTEEPRDAIILHAGQMPGQPGNGVGDRRRLALDVVKRWAVQPAVEDAV